MIENEQIKLISQIYDELCEEIRLVKRYSLPTKNPIETGKNYTAFKNLYLFLTKLGIIDYNHIKLYLRSQFEELWKIHKFKHKVIPINMMYNSNAVERHLNYINDIKEKYKIFNNKAKLEKLLDKLVSIPLLYDTNCVTLSYDINRIYKLLLKKLIEVDSLTEQDYFDIIKKVDSKTISGICPGYLITKPILSNIDSISIKNRIDRMNGIIKKRHISYYSSILANKNKIVEDDIISHLNVYYDDRIKNEILKWI